MNKVSLGIILPGNPDCIQKPIPWLRAFEYFFRFGWLAFLGAAIVFLILTFTKDADFFELTISLALVGVCIGIFSLLWDEKRRCPYCKHFFTMRRISLNQTIDTRDREISREINDHHSGIAFDLKGNSSLIFGRSSHTEYGTETTRTFTYNMRCKCCGCVNKVKDTRTSQSFH